MAAGKRERSHFDEEIFYIGDSVYFRGTPPGAKKQREVSLGLKRGALQKDILRRKADVIAGLSKVGSKTGRNSFDVIAAPYIKSREEEAENPEHFSQKSLTETKQLMNTHLIPFFGSKRIEEIDQPAFNDYCALKRKTLNLTNHRKVLNHFMKWCVSNGYLKYRPELVIPKSSLKSRRARVVLTNEEITKLVTALTELNKEGKIKEKHILYVVFYLFMGMRNMEICKLRWDEIDLEKRALKINKLNNRKRKERPLPVNSFALDLLHRLALTATSPWVFPSAKSTSKKPYMDPSGGFRSGWTKALERAKLDRHITPHDCRSTFETFMHTNIQFTDTQREKMAGASIDVQKNIYVTMDVERLRGLEESVQVPGLEKIFRENSRENQAKAVPNKPVKARNKKGNRR